MTPEEEEFDSGSIEHEINEVPEIFSYRNLNSTDLRNVKCDENNLSFTLSFKLNAHKERIFDNSLRQRNNYGHDNQTFNMNVVFTHTNTFM